MKLIHRWLAGEVVNNTVGIKLTGGPFNGRINIVQLDQDGLPPPGTPPCSRRPGTETWKPCRLAHLHGGPGPQHCRRLGLRIRRSQHARHFHRRPSDAHTA